jgi:transcriptional regulator with XRE-family HTH domain
MIADKIGEDQMWLSRRERGKPEPTVDDAILIAEGLGYAAELVILDEKHRDLLSAIGSISPDDVGLALRFLAVFGRVASDPRGRKLIRGTIELMEEQTSETSAG